MLDGQASPPAFPYEDHYPQLIANLADVVWVLDLDTGRFVYVSPSVTQLRGLSVAEVLNETIADALTPASLAYLTGVLPDRLAAYRRGDNGPYTDQIEQPCKDGTTFWSETVSRFGTDPRSGHLQVFGISRDITRRRELERALRQSEEQLSRVTATVPGAIYTLQTWPDGHSRFVYASPGFATLTGLPLETVLATDTLELINIHPDDLPAYRAKLEEAQRQQTIFALEFRIHHPEQGWRWIEARSLPRPQPDGSVLWYGYTNDISDRRAAEEALKDREAQYRAAIETTTDGFLVADNQGRVLEVNDAYCRRSGYSRDELLGMHLGQLDMEETPETVARHNEKILRQGGDVFQTRHRAKNGTLWPVEMQVAYWPIAGGRFFGFVHDLRRRQRADALLRARLQLSDLAQWGSLDDLMTAALDQAELLTGSQIGFFHFVDPDQETLTLQAWSTNTLRHICQAEGKGQHYPVSQAGVWVDCVHTRAPVIHNDYAGLAHKKGLPPGHAPVVRELVVPILRQGLVVAILGVGNKATDYGDEDVRELQELASLVTDLVERKRAEEALQQSEARYRALVETTSDWFWEVDAQGHYTYVSPRVVEVLGYTQAEVLGRTPFDFMPPEERQRVGVLFAEAVAAQRPFSGLLNTNLHRDGHRVILESSGVPIFRPDGQFLGYRGADRDLTARVQLEEQLRQSQKMDAIGQLAGGVAHDFNNLLTVIISSAELLSMRMPADDAKSRFTAEILHAAERAAALTRQLLAFSRKQVLAPEVLDLNDALSDIAKMLRRLIGENILLTTLLDQRTSRIKVDPSQLEQVILNLAVNARDAMPQGGRLIIETRDVELDAEDCRTRPECRSGRYALLSMTDTGQGMTPEVKLRIFEPFFTTKGVGKGTGLGLATVFGIVKQSEGYIEVDSEVGSGTTFRLYLPAVSEAAPGASADPGEPEGRGNELVLLVEDEEQVREMARLALEMSGYRVLVARNGAEALALAAGLDTPVDLLLTDVVMPELGGVELARTLQARQSGLRVLFMSGYIGDTLSKTERRGAGEDFLQKPFSPRHLTRKVRQLLDRVNRPPA